MKKFALFFIYLFPSVAFADLDKILSPQEKYELEEKLRIAEVAVTNNPYIGMATYGAWAFGIFVALIIIIFFLIMLLKR